MRSAQTQVWPALRYFEAMAAPDRHLDVGAVKDDERGVAARLERQFL